MADSNDEMKLARDIQVNEPLKFGNPPPEDDRIGGLLLLLRAIGKGVLFVLVGSKAGAKTETANNYALTTGGLAVGLVVGLVLYFSWLAGQDSKALICFLAIPVASVIIAFFLNHVRKEMG
jgi:hypothetical protein